MDKNPTIAIVDHKPPSVLLVEDDDSLRELFSLVIHRAGYQVQEASNLKDAVKIMNESEIDFVFSDKDLPDGSGCTLAELNSLRFGVPFVLCTATPDAESSFLKSSGLIFDVLLKPFDLGMFQQIMLSAKLGCV